MMDETPVLIAECPLCGAHMDQPETRNYGFLDFACPSCGLKWQACLVAGAQNYPQAARAWMQTLSQD